MFVFAVFAPLIPFIGQRAVLGLSGYVYNFAFVLAAFYLYRLSAIILKDSEVALRASIFNFLYTESMYALCSIGGLYYLMIGSNNIGTLWLALSGFARSNGVLNAGYICFQTMHRSYKAAFISKHAGAMETPVEAVETHLEGLQNPDPAPPAVSLWTSTLVSAVVELWPEVFVSLGFRVSSPNKELAASSIPLGRSAGSKSVGFPSENRSDSGQGDSVDSVNQL
ncbi:hypothetical protein HAX54_000407 [Datura stramonium]|uniref:GPI mannosyltransferase 2 n=1 Tax=Datura stramonium TaxID=4076 RepID=A0ABS8T1V3_DATST|nr:hypothetical protein [Datura stramonium]